ncbi:MAG: hypothetical protein IT582_09210 [Opitutaceae bacterium]|nr:hypothetical protein [Opitutaceae bacterium]
MKQTGHRPDRALWLLFFAVAALAVFLLTLSWRASILDRYEFRQLQTALTAYWLAHDGWSLAYPTPLFGPPWSIPMEFPSYQMLVAGWHQFTGMPLEQSGRLLSIAMLIFSLPALHDLLAVTRLAHSRRLIVHLAVLTAPVYLFYGRAFMIETTAVCGGVWFLALLRRSLDSPNAFWIIATTLAAVFTALTKITTWIVFALPAAVLVLAAWRATAPHQRLRLLPAAALPAVVGLMVAWWWVRFGDHVKDSNPFTGFLTSRELHTWNFGTWSLRWDWSFWLHLQETVNDHNLSAGALAVALLSATFAPLRARLTAVAACAGFISGPLVFANLYHLHDYYYTANCLLLVGSAGLMIAASWDDPRLPRGTNWLALTLLLGFQLHAYYRGYYSHHRHPAPAPPGLAALVRDHTPPDGVVLIYGADWNPMLPYYMQRRAVMVPGERENDTAVLDQVLARLPPHAISALIVHGPRLRAERGFGPGRARQFGLDPAPAAQSADDDLYLSTETDLGPHPPRDVTVLRQAASADWADGLKDEAMSGLPLDLFSPTPTALRGRYGFNLAPTPDGPVLNAHAPSELIFPASRNAGTLNATYGLHPGAYAESAAAKTNGITLEILVETANGALQRLYFRALDPVYQTADRGPQTVSLALPAHRGRLHLRLGNGPADDPTSDWAYWRAVELH